MYQRAQVLPQRGPGAGRTRREPADPRSGGDERPGVGGGAGRLPADGAIWTLGVPSGAADGAPKTPQTRL